MAERARALSSIAALDRFRQRNARGQKLERASPFEQRLPVASLFDDSATSLDDTTATVRALSPQPFPDEKPTSRPPPLPPAPAADCSSSRPPPLASMRMPRSPGRYRILLVAAVVVGFCGVATGGAFGLRKRAGGSGSTHRATVSRAPRSAPSPAPPAPSIVPTTGTLLTAPSEAGHRIFVDGRFAGPGGAPLMVRCGKHDVRVGSAGRLRPLEVPCGGACAVAR